jgi:hypothetical protein
MLTKRLVPNSGIPPCKHKLFPFNKIYLTCWFPKSFTLLGIAFFGSKCFTACFHRRPGSTLTFQRTNLHIIGGPKVVSHLNLIGLTNVGVIIILT